MKTVLAQRLYRPAKVERMRGFTLIELMTSLTVLAVVAVVAVPNLAGFVRSSKVRSAQSELVSSLMLARSEAAKRGTAVAVLATAPSVGNEFGAGWKVWVDTNSNGVVDGGETVLREYPGFAGAVVLSTTGNVTLLTFAPTGFASASVNFKVCSASDTAKGYSVALQMVGLADVAEGVTCP
jgi:type IV fimbrial biogenesis protein FimT